MKKLTISFVLLCLLQSIGYSQFQINLSQNIFNTPYNAPPVRFHTYNGKYYFGSLHENDHDIFIWSIDSLQGTSDILYTDNNFGYASCVVIGGINDKVLVQINRNWVNPYEFWVYNISNETFTMIHKSNNFDYILDIFEFNNGLYFTAYHSDVQGRTLFKAVLNDTAYQIASPVNVVGEYSSDHIVTLGNKILFVDDLSTQSLYSSDGTAAGAIKLTDFSPSVAVTHIKNLTVAGVEAYFLVDKFGLNENDELWKTDGTVSGTQKIIDMEDNDDYITYGACNNKYIFSYNDHIHGDELWVTDGTFTGTHILKDINPSHNTFEIRELIKSEQGAFFTVGLNSLWKTNGEESGTTLIKTFDSVLLLHELNGYLFFRAIDETNNGLELWISDGSPQGTYKIPAPSLSYNPLGLNNFKAIPFMGKLYFNATYDGDEKWYSIGGNTNAQINAVGFSLHPNPVTDFLTLTTQNPDVFIISNLSGTILYSVTVNGQQTIDISWLQSGMYLITSSTTGNASFFIKSN